MGSVIVIVQRIRIVVRRVDAETVIDETVAVIVDSIIVTVSECYGTCWQPGLGDYNQSPSQSRQR